MTWVSYNVAHYMVVCARIVAILIISPIGKKHAIFQKHQYQKNQHRGHFDACTNWMVTSQPLNG